MLNPEAIQSSHWFTDSRRTTTDVWAAAAVVWRTASQKQRWEGTLGTLLFVGTKFSEISFTELKVLCYNLLAASCLHLHLSHIKVSNIKQVPLEHYGV